MNHFDTWQINITDIQDPFVQEVGEIYWLDVRIDMAPTIAEIGWKTSQDHWNDDGVYWDVGQANPWRELTDPITAESLDFAFVIVPEPSTTALIGLSAMGMLGARRMRRRGKSARAIMRQSAFMLASKREKVEIERF